MNRVQVELHEDDLPESIGYILRKVDRDFFGATVSAMGKYSGLDKAVHVQFRDQVGESPLSQSTQVYLGAEQLISRVHRRYRSVLLLASSGQ